MLWTKSKQFHPWPYEKEAEVEAAIRASQTALFGASRHYLDVKKLIGAQGKTQNIPDGYLIDLSSKTEPTLYLVEVELARHDSIRHIAQQLLNFSLSFKSSPQKMKSILRSTLEKTPDTLNACEQYAKANGFNNVDYLLDKLIYGEDAFNSLVIIDDVEDELESILHNSLRFSVETLTIRRFRDAEGEVIYEFEPFLYDLSSQSATAATDNGNSPAIDPSEIDTLVVPAREDGFKDTFLGENMWRQVRIHSSMIPRIKHVAVYRIAPISAITHIGDVAKIDPWKDSKKYALYFDKPAREIPPIPLVPDGRIKAPQNIRYTSLKRIEAAKTLDDLF